MNEKRDKNETKRASYEACAMEAFFALATADLGQLIVTAVDRHHADRAVFDALEMPVDVPLP